MFSILPTNGTRRTSQPNLTIAWLMKPGLAYMLVLCPLWYIPHICLQNILTILDSGGAKRAAVAFAVLMIIARVGNLLIVLQQFNLQVPRARGRKMSL